MSERHRSTPEDDAARRAYWSQQMDAAFDFMAAMLDYPVEECGEKLASLPEAAHSAGVEVLFSQSKIALDLDRVFFLRAGLVEGFIEAAREMNDRGWIMKVEDGFRSVEMQRNLSRKPEVFDAILKSTAWECGEVPTPEFLLRRLSVLTATRPKVGTHMSGSAIDISVFRREDGSEVERGGPYLEMSEKTPMTSPFVSAAEQENRRAIKTIMERHGLLAYPFEFWHFNGGDCYAEYLTKSGRPGRYGAVDFNVENGDLAPVSDPRAELQSPAVMRELIEESLARLQASDEDGARIPHELSAMSISP